MRKRILLSWFNETESGYLKYESVGLDVLLEICQLQVCGGSVWGTRKSFLWRCYRCECIRYHSIAFGQVRPRLILWTRS